MADHIISPAPQSVTAVPGQNTTFTASGSSNYEPLSSITYNYQWYVNDAVIPGATSSSYFIDPLIGDNGKEFKVSVVVLSGEALPLNTEVVSLTSSAATLTVNEDAKPFDVYDLGPETGRERQRRLHLLGYV